MSTTVHAWCFSHGRLHTFRPTAEYPDGAWCTALWVPLDGADPFAAEKNKLDRYGDAQFIHHIADLDEQMRIHELAAARCSVPADAIGDC